MKKNRPAGGRGNKRQSGGEEGCGSAYGDPLDRIQKKAAGRHDGVHPAAGDSRQAKEKKAHQSQAPAGADVG